MNADDSLIDALRRAVDAAPSDVELRLHLVDTLLTARRSVDAVTEAAAVLARDASNARARSLMARALSESAGTPSSAAPTGSDGATPEPSAREHTDGGFNWSLAEADVGVDLEPPFVTPTPDRREHVLAADVGSAPVWDVERPALTLADVGGMTQVKANLTAAFLAPLRNPELRRLYSKSLNGGLLMWGPPGCGKTYIARGLAGELGAGFMSLGIGDVADVYRGGMEQNVHSFFLAARRAAPVVVFIDELDALGQRRTTRNSWNEVVNTLLVELDGVESSNDGVYVLGATNQPWAVDPALRRPGRFDRTVLVLPPDRNARERIFHHHLEARPVSGIDLRRLAKQSEGLTGADIALVCETAVSTALMDSVASGTARHVTMDDLTNALRRATSSIGPWLESAANVVTFGEDDGTFAELRAFLKSVKRL